MCELCSLFPVPWSSKIFLIVIMLDLPHFLVPWKRTGALSITSPVLFQLKIFLIFSNLFVQNPLYVITLKNLCLICWRLLLSGLRSVLKKCNWQLEIPQTNDPNCSRGLVRSGRATCTIASGVNFKFFSVNADRQAFHNHQILYILKYLLVYLRHQRIQSSLLISCSCKHVHFTQSNLNCCMIFRFKKFYQRGLYHPIPDPSAKEFGTIFLHLLWLRPNYTTYVRSFSAGSLLVFKFPTLTQENASSRYVVIANQRRGPVSQHPKYFA